MRKVYLVLRIVAVIFAIYFATIRAASAAACLPPGVTGFQCDLSTQIFGSLGQAVNHCRAAATQAAGVEKLINNLSWTGSAGIAACSAGKFWLQFTDATTRCITLVPAQSTTANPFGWTATSGNASYAQWAVMNMDGTPNYTPSLGGVQVAPCSDSNTAAQCAADLTVSKYPSPGETPAVVCDTHGCTRASDGEVYCDVLGANCFLKYTTAGAASLHTIAPTDGRFNPTCTVGQNPGQTTSDIDGDGVPNTEDGDTKDTDGDGIVDNKDNAPSDPNNSKDTTGNESDNTSTGGGDCSSAPVSKGDGIAAQVAFQTWKTRCAVEALGKAATGDGIKIKGTIATTGGGTTTVVVGGGTGTVSSGTSNGENCIHTYTVSGGDPINAQALVEAQRLRCQETANRAADAAGAENDGTGTGDPNAHWASAASFSPNDAGLGWGTAPPALPTIMGQTIPFQDKLVDIFAVIRWLVIMLATYKAAQMIADAT